MTYCVGWKREDVVYLAADSALTLQEEQSWRKISSFGEKGDRVGKGYVTEGASKIIEFERGAAIAAAGDWCLSREILIFVQQHIANIGSISHLFKMVNASIGPFQSNVSLLIAHSDKEGNAELYRWSSNSPERLECGEAFYEIGSMVSYTSLTPQIVEAVSQNSNLDRQQVLTAITALIQSYGIRDAMFQQHIGGAIKGLCTTSGSVEWRRDTAFVVYDDRLLDVDIIRMKSIDGALVVVSTITKDTLIHFMNMQWGASEKWLSRNNKHELLYGEMLSGKPAQWILISKSRWVILIVDGQAGSEYSANDSVWFSEGESGAPGIKLQHLLMPLLHTPNPDPRPAIVFHGNYSGVLSWG